MIGGIYYLQNAILQCTVLKTFRTFRETQGKFSETQAKFQKTQAKSSKTQAKSSKTQFTGNSSYVRCRQNCEKTSLS